MTPAQSMDILRLRLLVGALGERTDPRWWRTEVLTDAGFRTLGRVVPRTTLRAGLETVTLAAGKDHDRHIGARSYHLFRLPVDVENGLLDLLEEAQTFECLQRPEGNSEDLMEILEEFGRDWATASLGAGPRTVGPVTTLTENGLAALAAAYAEAVREEYRVYPYLEAPETGR